MAEQTATIVWEQLSILPELPLLWNSFPFHPYQKTHSTKNRTPKEQEIRIGKGFLRYIIDLYSIDYIIPVGNKAEASLRSMGSFNNKLHEKVRHPAKGGKNEFIQGLRKFYDAYI